MRAKNLLQLVSLGTLLLALSPVTSQGQNATYIGPVTGGEWNTVANWDIGVPGPGTNALVGPGTNVSYNLEMTTGGFGVLTVNGILNVNTDLFTCASITMPSNTTSKIFINNGANVTVNGNFTLSTNASATMTAGSTLTVNGTLGVSFGTSTHAAGTASFTNSGGVLMANSTAVNNNAGTENALMVISGGTNNLGTTVIGRSAASSFGNPPGATEGLDIYNGLVTTTNLNVGNNGVGVSFLTCLIANGTVTNYGNAYVNQGTAARGSRLLQTGGLFVVPDPGIVNLNGYAAATAPTAAVINIYSVTGGTNIVGGFYFGNTNGTAVATLDFTNSAVVYVGSQGISSNGAAITLNTSLNNNGMFGATAPWTNVVPLRLLSGAFTFKTADMSGITNPITLNAPLIGGGSLLVTGGGTLTLGATNTFIGNTIVSSGALSLGTSGTLASPGIYFGSGTVFDVSQLTGYSVNSGQTLSSFGAVNGSVNVASGGAIEPGSNTVTGTLTISGGLTETNNAVNEFDLSTTSGANDLMTVAGNLSFSGTNNFLLTAVGGGTIGNGTYPLIKYSGTLSGGTSNFTVTAVGVVGTLTNLTTTTPPEIAVIIAPAARGATNLIWKGDGGLNNWDTTSSNWFNGAISYAFQAGDSVFFTDAGTPNTNVNLTVTVLPASVIFSNTLQYTLSGNGSIDGSVGITKTNTGIAVILTTNNYTGPTIINQGVLSTPVLANSTLPSAIGAASADPGNLVLNGGTLAYFGPSTSTDRGINVTNGGGTIDVSNSINLTLNGNIAGPGVLALTDTGTLTLPNDSTYTGGTVISNGVLALGSNIANNDGTGSAVGPTNAPVTFAGGTLKLYGNGLSTGANYSTFYNPLVVPTGQTGILLMFPRGPTDTGGGAGLFSSLSGGGTLNLHVNYIRDALSGNWSGFTGLIMVTNAGAAGGDEMRINNNFGYANATIYLDGAFTMDTTLNTNMTVNIGELGGVSSAIIGPGSKSQPGPTWVVGWKNTTNTFAGAIEDDNTAPGGHTSIIKVGTGTWNLYGGLVTNIDDSDPLFPTTIVAYTDLMSFTGNTTVSNGTLSLEGADALTNSTVITLASPSAVLDASSLGYNSNQLDSDEVTVTNEVLVTNSIVESLSGQTIAGIGTINGFLLQDSGSTFNVGLPTGAFNVTSNANLSGAVNMNLSGNTSSELVSPSITINSATLVVTNVGLGLTNGVTFTLFNHPVTGFASVTLPPTDPTGTTNYVWANNLSSNGTITLTSGGLVAVTARPTIGFSHSGNSLSLSWSTSGFTLQMQTNAPSVGLSTNWVNVPGSTSITSTNITINPTNATFFQLVQ